MLVRIHGYKRGALVFGTWRVEGLCAGLRASQTDLDRLFLAFCNDFFFILKRIGASLDLEWLIVLM